MAIGLQGPFLQQKIGVEPETAIFFIVVSNQIFTWDMVG